MLQLFRNDLVATVGSVSGSHLSPRSITLHFLRSASCDILISFLMVAGVGILTCLVAGGGEGRGGNLILL